MDQKHKKIPTECSQQQPYLIFTLFCSSRAKIVSNIIDIKID